MTIQFISSTQFETRLQFIQGNFRLVAQVTALAPLSKLFSELPQIRSIEVEPLAPLVTLRYHIFDAQTPRIFSLGGYGERDLIVTFLALQKLETIPLIELKLAGIKINLSLWSFLLQRASHLKKFLIYNVDKAHLDPILEVLGRFCLQLEVCHFQDVFSSHELDLELLNRCSQMRELSFVNYYGPLEEKLNKWLLFEKRNLQRVTFTDCLDIQISTLEALETNPLRYLSMTRCSALHGGSLAHIVHLSLVTFHFNGMAVEYRHLYGHEVFFGRLEQLSMADCDLTSESADWIAEHCQNLTYLCLKGNQQIGHSSLLRLATLPKLKHLDVREISLPVDGLRSDRVRIIQDSLNEG